MRIGFDCVQASVRRAGGGWYASILLQEMAAVAPQHDFLAYRNFGAWFLEPARLAPLPHLPNICDPLAGRPQEEVIARWHEALARKDAPGQPDLVHSTSFQAPVFAPAKLVVTIFDLSFWAVPEFTTEGIRIQCQSGVLDALERADGLIFISEHARREFEQFLPLERRRKIPSIVTPLASRWPIWSGKPAAKGDYWLFVGSIEPRKNILQLLEAYEAYAAGHPQPLPLWMAGSGGWKNERILQRMAELEKRGMVRRLGYVPDADLPQVYREAHALVFTSWYEGFGLPVLEAMTQGCPVICSDRASLPEVGGDAVHYVDPASPQELVNALKQLEQATDYRTSLIERGWMQASRFSWQQTAKLTLAFYEAVTSTQLLHP